MELSISHYYSHLRKTSIMPPIYKWRMVVSGTWKYDDPRLNMSHEGGWDICSSRQHPMVTVCSVGGVQTTLRGTSVAENTFIQGLEIAAHCDSWLLCAMVILWAQPITVVHVSAPICSDVFRRRSYIKIIIIIINWQFQTRCNMETITLP